MNWVRVLIRFVLSFVILYVLGYVIPGFSGLTVPMLIALGALIALISSLVEMAIKPTSMRNRALIFFLISAGVIYLFSVAMVGRPPLISTIIAGILLAVLDLVYPERTRNEQKM